MAMRDVDYRNLVVRLADELSLDWEKGFKPIVFPRLILSRFCEAYPGMDYQYVTISKTRKMLNREIESRARNRQMNPEISMIEELRAGKTVIL